ncbi:MAG: DNA repair protein RecO [Candidatus Glassbacteria bacterium]
MDPARQNAIIVGGVNYSDSSRVIWAITPDYGRQSFLVKGARRAGSKYLGCLETFNHVVLIYRKGRGGSLFTLREVDVVEHFSGIRRSLDAFWAASEAVELVKSVVHEEQESNDAFGLLLEFLRQMDSPADPAAVKTLLAALRWRLAAITGHEPQLVDCVRCGTRLTRQEKYRFLPAQGGIACDQCGTVPAGGGTDQPSALLVSYPALRFIYRSGRKFPPAEQTGTLPPEVLKEVETIAGRYLAYHFGETARPAGSLPKTGG